MRTNSDPLPLQNRRHLYSSDGWARVPAIRSYPTGTIQAMSEPQVPDDGVKHLTTSNWLEPDPICLKFVGVNLATAERRPPTGVGWAERFLAVDLAPTVASEVRDM